MTVKPIITLPDPLLRKASAPVERVDEELRKLADDMLETMYAAPGVGLAAVQVGVPRRLVVLDTAKDEEPPRPLVLINPEIVTLGSEMRLHEEGCLSIPDVRIEIERPASLTVRYLDREGKPQELAAEGLLATAIQHEIDHLNGKLIIDFLSRLKRDIIVRKFKKQAKAEAERAESARGRGRPISCASSSWERRISRCRRWRRSWRRGIEVVAVYTQPPAPGRARHGRAQVAGACLRRGAGIPVSHAAQPEERGRSSRPSPRSAPTWPWSWPTA